MRDRGKDNRYAIVHGEDSNHTLAALDPVLGCQTATYVVSFFDEIIEKRAGK